MIYIIGVNLSIKYFSIYCDARQMDFPKENSSIRTWTIVFGYFTHRSRWMEIVRSHTEKLVGKLLMSERKIKWVKSSIVLDIPNIDIILTFKINLKIQNYQKEKL